MELLESLDVILEVCDDVSAKVWVLADAGYEVLDKNPLVIIGTYLMTGTLPSWVELCSFLATPLVAKGAVVVASAVWLICRQCVGASLLYRFSILYNQLDVKRETD